MYMYSAKYKGPMHHIWVTTIYYKYIVVSCLRSCVAKVLKTAVQLLAGFCFTIPSSFHAHQDLAGVAHDDIDPSVFSINGDEQKVRCPHMYKVQNNPFNPTLTNEGFRLRYTYKNW